MLCRQSVTFLGDTISADGIMADPAKTSKVANWPIPTCCRDVPQFLGLANYYRKFIQDFCQIAKPLHQLTEKTAAFSWSDRAQCALDTLCKLLVSVPVLAHPDFAKPFILETDGIAVGTGAVLSQVQRNSQERVVACASRVLRKADRRCCTTR